MVHPYDLQARAEMAARSLTALLDPERQGLIYFVASWAARPPRADHCLWDCGDGSGRHLDALTLVRSMVRTGSPAATPTAGGLQLEAWTLRLLGRHGLSWLLDEPFARPWQMEQLLHAYDPEEAYAEISWAQRGALLGLTSRYLATGDERFRAAGARLVDGLLAVAVPSSEGLFFPEGYLGAGGWRRREPGLYPGLDEYNAAVLVSCVRFYRAATYPPALRLAEGLADHALAHAEGYLPDGRLWPGDGPGRGQGTLDHFHTRANFLLGVLELAVATGRAELLAWARRSYDHAREWGTDFGWFPEGMGHRHGEICCTTDMIEAALLLGQHLDRRYYADAERFGRNHLFESQVLSLPAFAAGVGRLPPDTAPAPGEGRYSTVAGVLASQLGGFAARPSLNDALHADAPAMMQCCNAAGARGLFGLWRHAVTTGAIHLRFSTQTPWLRVVSHEPAQGRLDILPTEDGPLEIRLPEGVGHAEVSDRTGDRRAQARDGYVQVRACAGQPLVLRYALPERECAYEVGSPGRSLRCAGRWRGETLIAVDPQGPYCPLYRRSTDLPPVEPSLPADPGLASPPARPTVGAAP